MCSRYCLTMPPDAVSAFFDLAAVDAFPPRYNIAPSQPVGIVRNGPRAREFALVRWGLIPSWVKDPREFAMLVNARAETASDKPSFRGSLRHRRCLIAATGYYEWAGRRGCKVPHLIRPCAGGLMAMAGLWEHWLGADGSELDTMAILTTAANAVTRHVHERMPVIIAPCDFERWLDCQSGSALDINDLLQPAPDGLLEALPIDPGLNDLHRDGPELWHQPRDKLL